MTARESPLDGTARKFVFAKRMNVLDCFAGTGSATRFFKEAGHEVERVEIAEGVDIRTYHPPHKFDFIWASPPCTEYSSMNRLFSTWESKYRASQKLWRDTLRVIREARPRLWIIENVRGAQQVHGKAPYHYGPGQFLWGYFPFQFLPVIPWTESVKGTHADRSIVTTKNGGLYQWDDGKTAAEKAMIPPQLARAVYEETVRFFADPEIDEPKPEAAALETFA